MNAKNKIYIGFCITLILNNCVWAQNSYKDGLKEYFSRNYSKAINLFTNSIENKQAVARSYVMRARSYAWVKQFQKAFKDIDSARKMIPSDYYLYDSWGKVFFLQQKFDSALKYYNASIKIKPSDTVYDDRATVKGFLGDIPGTVSDDSAAISLDSTVEQFWSNKGYAEFKLSRFSAAMHDYNKALKMENDPYAFANRAILYSYLGDETNAIKDYSTALKLEPDKPLVYYYRGTSYMNIGQKDSACADFKKSADLGCKEALSKVSSSCK